MNRKSREINNYKFRIWNENEWISSERKIADSLIQWSKFNTKCLNLTTKIHRMTRLSVELSLFIRRNCLKYVKTSNVNKWMVRCVRGDKIYNWNVKKCFYCQVNEKLLNELMSACGTRPSINFNWNLNFTRKITQFIFKR